MQISKDSAVEFHYTLSEAGEQIESSKDGEPLSYIHGTEGMLPGLEKALEGKVAGDNFSVTLEPSESYGERVDNLIQRIPLKHLQGNTKVWKPGMTAIVHYVLWARLVANVMSKSYLVLIRLLHLTYSTSRHPCGGHHRAG